MLRDLRVKALLTEYESCHTTKYHYDSVRWTIASIFVGFSLTTFGVSFLDKANAVLPVLLLASFSISLFVIAIAWYEHVNPWIETSQDRLWEIEAQLSQYFGIDVRLHRLIRAKSGRFEGRGTMIKNFLVVIVIVFWGLRIALVFIRGQ